MFDEAGACPLVVTVVASIEDLVPFLSMSC